MVRIVNIRVKVKDNVSVKGSGLGLGSVLGAPAFPTSAIPTPAIETIGLGLGTVNVCFVNSVNYAVHTNCYNFVVASHYHCNMFE